SETSEHEQAHGRIGFEDRQREQLAPRASADEEGQRHRGQGHARVLEPKRPSDGAEKVAEGKKRHGWPRRMETTQRKDRRGGTPTGQWRRRSRTGTPSAGHATSGRRMTRDGCVCSRCTSKSRTSTARNRLASRVASCAPIHARAPAPNGRNVYGTGLC